MRGEGDASVAIYAISYYYLQAGFTFNRTVGRGQNAKRGRKRKLLIDGFAAPQAEPLRVSEFQAHPGTHPHVVRAGIASQFLKGKPVAYCASGCVWRRKKVN